MEQLHCFVVLNYVGACAFCLHTYSRGCSAAAHGVCVCVCVCTRAPDTQSMHTAQLYSSWSRSGTKRFPAQDLHVNSLALPCSSPARSSAPAPCSSSSNELPSGNMREASMGETRMRQPPLHWLQQPMHQCPRLCPSSTPSQVKRKSHLLRR